MDGNDVGDHLVQKNNHHHNDRNDDQDSLAKSAQDMVGFETAEKQRASFDFQDYIVDGANGREDEED